MKKASLVLILFFVFLSGILFFPYEKFYDYPFIINQIQKTKEDIPNIDRIDDYLKEKESKSPNLRKGLEKSIVWVEQNKKQKTEYSLVYLPGFTATRMEIYPVIEKLALEFKANAFYSRLPGHGQEADDFKNRVAGDFFSAAAEAIEIGHKIGNKPIYVGMSTGASVLQYVLSLNDQEGFFVALSPAFFSRGSYINFSLIPWLGAEIIKLFVGEYYQWKAKSEQQERYWNTKYNTDIIVPLSKVFRIVSTRDYSSMKNPTLLVYNKNDKVIDANVMISKWKQLGNIKNKFIELESSDSHVVCGDIVSPENTQRVVKVISDWILER